VSLVAKGYGSVETWQTYNRALELSTQADNKFGIFTALSGMWLSSNLNVNHLQQSELTNNYCYIWPNKITTRYRKRITLWKPAIESFIDLGRLS